jgi:hypothetical protein
MVKDGECCICYEIFKDNEDNTSGTSCKICKNKICIRCYDKSTELRMNENKFYKIVNNCCICRIETEKTNLNEFSKEQLGQLLITAYEKLNHSQTETQEYKERYEAIEDINNSLRRIVESTKRILETKKISKSDIKMRLGIIVNNSGIF